MIEIKEDRELIYQTYCLKELVSGIYPKTSRYFINSSVISFPMFIAYGGMLKVPRDERLFYNRPIPYFSHRYNG
jgi:hypothetical protein